MEYNPLEKQIILNRKLNKLDKFVLDFLKVIKRHVDYVIISGYISILLGRSRATEDIDIFIKKISEKEFASLYDDLVKSGFWCLNSDDSETIFSYLHDGLAVRFSYEEKPVPNIEVKFPKNELDEGVFEDFIIVKIPNKEIKISSLERHIAFKRYFLGSDKDIEDALHVEEIFKDKIDFRKIEKLKKLIKERQNEKEIS